MVVEHGYDCRSVAMVLGVQIWLLKEFISGCIRSVAIVVDARLRLLKKFSYDCRQCMLVKGL